ncbi:MAG TPA: hypothetical protein VM939_00825 [Gemmatimonadaceae bacterium]|nr:hypothetical protein [Gemmatimonadaceae bacterium]
METNGPSKYVHDAGSPVERALNLLRLMAGSRRPSERTVMPPHDASSVAVLQDALSQAERSLRLHAAIERTASKSSESMEALRLAVCAFTLAMREQGQTPEAVLIHLKEAIQAETLGPFWRLTDEKGPILRETITTWCIKDYFREQERAE